MKRILFAIAVFSLILPNAARAQEIVKDPICFTVRNDAPYKVYGSFTTDLYQREDGAKARHRSNFRLDEANAVDDKGQPSDRAEFCSYGPFFEGRKLEMTLRTLVPIFSCQTKIESGEIVIHGQHVENKDGVSIAKTWADCFE